MSRLKRFITVGQVFVLTLASFGAQAYAQSDTPAINPADIRGETPETKKSVAVLHSRFFKKAHRIELGVMTGFLTDEAYFDSRGLGGRVGYFFSEWLGVEAQYIKMDYEKSDDYRRLEFLSKSTFRKEDPAGGFNEANINKASIVPEINPATQIIDAAVVFAPFYGKLSLSNALTVYSDVYFTLGYSKVDTSRQGIIDENHNAVSLGLGQRLYFTRSLSLRFDFRARMYNDKLNGEDYNKKAYYMDFGLSWFL